MQRMLNPTAMPRHLSSQELMKNNPLLQHGTTSLTRHGKSVKNEKQCIDQDSNYCRKLEKVFTDKFIFYCDYVAEATTKCKNSCKFCGNESTTHGKYQIMSLNTAYELILILSFII